MRRATLIPATLLILSAALVGTSQPPAPDHSLDIAAIKKNTVAFQAAWNKHDVKALAALWTKDGDVVDAWGVNAVGRDMVERFFVLAHPNDGTSSTSWDTKKDSVRLVTSDVALQDWDVDIGGVMDGKPLESQLTRVVIISRKEGSGWLIAGARLGPAATVRPGVPAKATPSK